MARGSICVYCSMLVATFVCLFSSSIRDVLQKISLEKKDNATRKESISLSENMCGQHPWTLECFHHYNAGDWTTLDHPRNWSQQIGYHKWSTGPKNCERMGKTLEWKSLHNSPSVFDGNAFLEAVGQNKVVSFIGDSVSRQSFAVLLDAIQTPPQVCNWAPFSKNGAQLNITFPTECVLALGENDTTNITFRMHNEIYGDYITNETYFKEADIIVLNFGVWYVEQQGHGRRTNHTPSNYVSHMVQILKGIETSRKPHQLIVFRESAEMLKPSSESLQKMTQELRSILIEHRIPIIAHQSAHLKKNFPDLFHDAIHWCEPALQLAWLTIFLHIVKDWNSSQ